VRTPATRLVLAVAVTGPTAIGGLVARVAVPVGLLGGGRVALGSRRQRARRLERFFFWSDGVDGHGEGWVEVEVGVGAGEEGLEAAGSAAGSASAISWVAPAGSIATVADAVVSAAAAAAGAATGALSSVARVASAN
jgi:hypothetical protein